MKQSPILFSTAMVQAILTGRKSQTRRIVKPQPEDGLHNDDKLPRSLNSALTGWNGTVAETGESKQFKFPYGKVGDMLYIRETWCKIPHGPDSFGPYLYKSMGDKPYGRWRPSIHMPKDAARIWLKIADIWVERLQDISEEDAKAEGVLTKQTELGESYWDYTTGYCNGLFTARRSFQSLWESINGHESWEASPWVWCISFERIEKPE